jgi:hypothetical protein
MASIFLRGMVVDVVSTPSGQPSLDRYKSLVNVAELKAFPRNTAIVKQVSRGNSKLTNKEIVCYPFFSSHLCMPLKPGEFVWFVYEDPSDEGQVAYWISRINEPEHVEDANFTFSTRTYSQLPVKSAKKSSDKFDAPTVESDEIETNSYKSPTSDPNEFVRIVDSVQRVHRFEPVPRYSKRPGDLVLQGSNNTLIMLGEERGQAADDPAIITTNSNSVQVKPGSGAVDIVVGRGKFASTSGKVIKNELGISEIDKREKDNIEGDAHFPTDAARLYLTANSDRFSKSSPDELLQLTYSTDASTGEASLSEPGSFFVGKADNLRLVARSAGCIRIVKEPDTADGGDLLNGSSLTFYKNGVLQAAAKEVHLCSYYSDTGANQPYVRYYPLQKFLSAVMQDIMTFCDTLKTHTTPGYGAPSPQINIAADILKKTIQSRKLAFDSSELDINSTKVFGE